MKPQAYGRANIAQITQVEPWYIASAPLASHLACLSHTQPVLSSSLKISHYVLIGTLLKCQSRVGMNYSREESTAEHAELGNGRSRLQVRLYEDFSLKTNTQKNAKGQPSARQYTANLRSDCWYHEHTHAHLVLLLCCICFGFLFSYSSEGK